MTWCFTPCQLVRLYQRYIRAKNLQNKTANQSSCWKRHLSQRGGYWMHTTLSGLHTYTVFTGLQCVRAWGRAWGRACVRAYVRACVSVRTWERERVRFMKSHCSTLFIIYVFILLRDRNSNVLCLQRTNKYSWSWNLLHVIPYSIRTVRSHNAYDCRGTRTTRWPLIWYMEWNVTGKSTKLTVLSSLKYCFTLYKSQHPARDYLLF